MTINLDAAGPDQIRDGFTTGATAATDRADEAGQVSASMSEIADRYAALGMAASTVGTIRSAATRYTAAAAALHGAGEDLRAALADFNAHDGLVATAAANVGNLAGVDVLTGDGPGHTATATSPMIGETPMSSPSTDQPSGTDDEAVITPAHPAEEYGLDAGLVYLLADPDNGMMRLLPVGSAEWAAAAATTRLLHRRLDNDDPTEEQWAQLTADLPQMEDIEDDDEVAHAARAVILTARAAATGNPGAQKQLTDQAVDAASTAYDDDGWLDGFEDKVDAATEEASDRAERSLRWERESRQKILATLAAFRATGASVDEVTEMRWNAWDQKQWPWLHHHAMIAVDAHDAVTLTEQGREYLASLCWVIDQMPPPSLIQPCGDCGNPTVRARDLDDPDADGAELLHPVTVGNRISWYSSCPPSGARS